MSRSLDPAVPPALRALLEADPGDPAADGVTLLLLTLREDGWPHQAMLSVGEVALAGEDGLRIATWASSSSTRNLRAHGRATLTAVLGGVAYALRLALHERGPLTVSGSAPLACFDARVVAASADEAPYARLLGGVRFALHDREATIARWRETRARLAGEDAAQ